MVLLMLHCMCIALFQDWDIKKLKKKFGEPERPSIFAVQAAKL